MGWVIALLLSIPVAHRSPMLAMGLLVLAGWLSLSSWEKRLAAPKHSLRHILLGSYALQLAVTGLFFAASWNAWPLWHNQQLGSGFWQFAIDAPTYHLNATRIMDAFRLHQPLPGNIAAPEFAAFIALIYSVWGIQSLFICLFNAWVRGVAVLFGYLLGRRLLNARAGRRAALLVGFWPSLFIWSSQLLRETVCLSILLGVLYGLVSLWQSTEQPVRTSTRLRLVVGVAVGILLLTQVRWYLALMLWMTGLAVCLIALIQRVFWGRRGVGDAVLAFLVVILAFGVGRFQDPMRWLPMLMPPVHQVQPLPQLAVEPLSSDSSTQRTISTAASSLAEQKMVPDAHLLPPPTTTGGPPSSGSSTQQTVPASPLLALQEVVHLEHQSLSVRSDARPEVRQLWVQLKEAMENTQQEPTTTRPPSPDQGRFEWGYVGPKFGDWRSWRLINWISAKAARNLYATRWASLERAHTVIAPTWDTSTTMGTLTFLPYGVLSAVLAPWPSQWFHGSGFTGAFKGWSSVEVLFIYGLLASLVLGIVRAFIRPFRPAHVGMVFFILLGLTFLSLTVATVGTMFRLRLHFLIPLAILGCAVEPTHSWFDTLLWYNWKPFAWRRMPHHGDSHPTTVKPVRVLRIITRMNIGGPAIHVSLLSAGLDPQRFPTCVVVGSPDAHEGDLSSLLEKAPVTLLRLPALQRAVNVPRDLKAFVTLLRVVWREQPRLIHTHMAKAGTLGRLAGCCYNWIGPGRRQDKRAMLIHTFHGHVLDGYFSHRRSNMFRAIECWLARRTDCLIAVSNTVQEELLALGIGRADQWRVIPLGLDLSTLEQLPLPTAEGPLRVGMVGRLAAIKNPQLFLEAIGRLAQQASTDIRGVVVGDGPLRRELERQVRQMGLDRVVAFTGWQRDLARVYANLEVTCITSWNEGTPVSMIETMAAGRTVVATDVGGVRDVLDDAHGPRRPIAAGGFQVTDRGILVSAGDAEGLAGALTAVTHDAALRQRLGQAARAYVIKRFGVDRLCRDIITLYDELLAGRPT